jgi:hypothetical protein
LVPDEGRRLRVRLFARPVVSKLDSLAEREKFVLASVIWHESISVEECAAALGYSVDSCQVAFERLRAESIIESRDLRFRVRTEWWSSVVRYLRRKHLIES